jgi:ATP-dependent RNA helicase RhlE
MTGDAFTFVAPNEEGDLRNIERALGRRLPRVTVPEFDYNARPAGKLEVPLAERIAGMRARKKHERTRSAGKAARDKPSSHKPSSQPKRKRRRGR